MKCDKYTLDRYEGDVGILLLKEDESQELLVKKEWLKGAQEGDILLVETQDNVVSKVTILKEETEDARKKVETLLNKLKSK